MAPLRDFTTPAGRTVPGRALTWTASRSGGPGGQHANTSDTRVVLELVVDAACLPDEVARRLRAQHGDVVRVVAADSRSQWRNRALARERLGALVDQAHVVPRARRRTAAPRGAVEARLDAKRRRGETKSSRAWRPDE